MNSSDECSVAQLSTGTVVMNIRNYIDQKYKKITTGAGHIVRALADSSDMGATWGPVNTTACKRLFSLGCVAHTDAPLCSRWRCGP